MDGGSFSRVDRIGAITVVTINRPEVLNALHAHAHRELAAVFDAFAEDPTQRVAILTGAGSRAFCAGHDLKFQAKEGEVERPPSGFGGLTSRFNLDKPLIAAVNGIAAGGGFEMALACDLIVASHVASFSLPEPRVGLAALAGGLLRLPRQVGLKQAMGLILTGRRMEAAEAWRMGVVNEVTHADKLMDSAMAWAAMILECSPASVSASKQAVRIALEEPDLKRAMDAHRFAPAVQQLRQSPDFKEGPRAFAERRKPEWTVSKD